MKSMTKHTVACEIDVPITIIATFHLNSDKFSRYSQHADCTEIEYIM